jgi:hypothetical protein
MDIGLLLVGGYVAVVGIKSLADLGSQWLAFRHDYAVERLAHERLLRELELEYSTDEWDDDDDDDEGDDEPEPVSPRDYDLKDLKSPVGPLPGS